MHSAGPVTRQTARSVVLGLVLIGWGVDDLPPVPHIVLGLVPGQVYQLAAGPDSVLVLADSAGTISVQLERVHPVQIVPILPPR